MSEESLIFVPDAADFYSFDLVDLANATDGEFNAMVALNQATTDWIGGKINTAEYTDILGFYGVNPDQHLSDIGWYSQELSRL